MTSSRGKGKKNRKELLGQILVVDYVAVFGPVIKKLWVERTQICREVTIIFNVLDNK